MTLESKGNIADDGPACYLIFCLFVFINSTHYLNTVLSNVYSEFYNYINSIQ